MKVHAQLASVLYKLALAGTAAVGVLSACGVFTGVPRLAPLRYYTVLVSALCAVYYLLQALHGLFSNREIFLKLRGGLLILLLVSVLIDAASLNSYRGTELSYLLLHYATPLLAVLDWLLFGEKGRYRWTSPLLWLIAPNLYYLYAVLLGKYHATAGCLYAFVNVEAYGWKQFLYTVLLLDFVTLAMGYLFVSIAKLLIKRKKKRKRTKKASS